MLLTLTPQTTATDVDHLVTRLTRMNLNVQMNQYDNRYMLTILDGLDESITIDDFRELPFVEDVVTFKHPFRLASRDGHPQDTVIQLHNTTIGGGNLTIMAGSCSVESEEQIFTTAKAVSEAGATVLRGGAFKPRTSPYSFQGLGEEGLRYLQQAAKAHNLAVVTEVMSIPDIELVANYADILQLGSRNMQNFSLLKALGKIDKPVLLKRGLCATIEEFLLAAEYILQGGNANVMLCERGIRSYDTYTRNILDIAAVPIVKQLSHLPMIVDPSHGTGRRELVLPMAIAATAVGADGLIVETHPDPDFAMTDAKQTIDFATFKSLTHKTQQFHNINNENKI